MNRWMSILGIALTAFLLLPDLSAADTPKFSDWSAPVNLGGVVNSTSADVGSAISKNGLSLYFSSNRPGGFGDFDIYVSQRQSVDDPWGAPENLGSTINTGANEAVPALSRDGHWLFFNSRRPGGVGGNDLWVSYREHVHDDLDWQTPVNLGSGVNSGSDDAGASFFENDDSGVPLLFFTSARPRPDGSSGGNDIYVSEQLPDGSFGPATLVAELSSPKDDQRPAIRFDGLELFLFSNREGTLGDFDLWVATRNTVAEFWSTPVNLGATINSSATDQQPYIGSDGETLFFSSDRDGGFGARDLYVTTRTRKKGP